MGGGPTPSLLRLLLSFSLFLISTFLLATPTSTPSRHQHSRHHSSSKRRRKPASPPSPQRPSSWELFKNFLTCKQVELAHVHDPTTAKKKKRVGSASASKRGYAKLASCSSLCTMNDVAANSSRGRVVHRSDSSSSPEPSISSSRRESAPLVPAARSASSGRGMPLRRLSGCYECRAVVDPSRYPSARPSICACPDCGEVFVKAESLEAHQAVRHAVSELGREDSGRNIVEIIFQSSWLKRDSPLCQVDRILKIHNTARTVRRFEGYRDSVKSRASRRNPRCVADGNELLRFFCTTFACSIGTRGSTSLCGSGPSCGVCNAIRHGFGDRMAGGKGLCTTATSGRAHDCMETTEEEKAASRGRRAMLVCRVIAGRIRRGGSGAAISVDPNEVVDDDDAGGLAGERFDSVTGPTGVYSNPDELFVFDPKAILPCFVVIYRVQDNS
ncbi:uncharacterized protein LOC116261596 [Nymphaea colorata]|nr:uncharacterized protein LOC116261596 [Nymphaea colorata]